MKQLKFLTMALAMVLGLTMTSCLDSDEGMPYYTAIVKVNASYLGMGVSFETNTGYTIEPSQASYLESISNGFDWDSYSGQLILLGYSYDEASPDVTVNDDGVSGVNLLNMSTLNSKLEIVNAEGAANDSVSNMPIIGLGDDATIKPAFWDEETLLLPINYFMWDGYTNPLKSHLFTLEYHAYEEWDGTLRLYLEHDKGMDTSSQYTSYQLGSIPLYYRAFDLRPLQRYLSGNGIAMPSSVTIITREDEHSTTLSDSTPTEEYVVTYSPTTNN